MYAEVLAGAVLRSWIPNPDTHQSHGEAVNMYKDVGRGKSPCVGIQVPHRGEREVGGGGQWGSRLHEGKNSGARQS